MNGFLLGNDKSFGSILLSDYAIESAKTDVLGSADLTRVQQGLFGEVGGIMATAKKQARDGAAYPGFKRAAIDEFGDALWYLAAMCRRLGLSLNEIFEESLNSEMRATVLIGSDLAPGSLARLAVPVEKINLDVTLFALGQAAAELLDEQPTRTQVEAVAKHYLDALSGAGLSFPEVAYANLEKIKEIFMVPTPEELSQLDFDEKFPSEEQLPRSFRIRINQRASGRSYLQWNDVFVGDPLTDNSRDRDGYRFHDVFHFAHAAILHWSPVMRALLKQKRKSKPTYDEEQDSGRAIVVEEGLTAWIFSRSKEMNFFEGQKKLSLDILKTIREFVAGYEVQACPLRLWERAILDGYDVFRKVHAANGGWVVGSRTQRTIQFEPLE